MLQMTYHKVSDENLEALLKLSKFATSGPWSWAPPDMDSKTWAIYETLEDDPPIVECWNWQEEDNAKLIAVMRNCIEDMIYELKELRAAAK